MSNQKDAGADDKNTMSPDELNFALTEEDLAHYLRQVRPEGYECPLCGCAEWGPVLSSQGQNDEARAYPTSLQPEIYRAANPSARMYLGARGNYELLCANCGHVIGFNAGMVASRLAVWKKVKNNG